MVFDFALLFRFYHLLVVVPHAVFRTNIDDDDDDGRALPRFSVYIIFGKTAQLYGAWLFSRGTAAHSSVTLN